MSFEAVYVQINAQINAHAHFSKISGAIRNYYSKLNCFTMGVRILVLVKLFECFFPVGKSSSRKYNIACMQEATLVSYHAVKAENVVDTFLIVKPWVLAIPC